MGTWCSGATTAVDLLERYIKNAMPRPSAMKKKVPQSTPMVLSCSCYRKVATTYCTTALISSVVSLAPKDGILVPPLVTRPTIGDASLL